jgi:hypothetical protein
MDGIKGRATLLYYLNLLHILPLFYSSPSSKTFFHFGISSCLFPPFLISSSSLFPSFQPSPLLSFPCPYHSFFLVFILACIIDTSVYEGAKQSPEECHDIWPLALTEQCTVYRIMLSSLICTYSLHLVTTWSRKNILLTLLRKSNRSLISTGNPYKNIVVQYNGIVRKIVLSVWVLLFRMRDEATDFRK